MLSVHACGAGKRFSLGKLGSLVCDSCGLYSIWVGLPVSPPRSGFNTLSSTSRAELNATLSLLKGNSVLCEFDRVESLFVTILNTTISTCFITAGSPKVWSFRLET